jgi:branched-chain amino acid transport system permease protein
VITFLFAVITTGMLYALLAAGFVVIYRASRILNFAYADMVTLAGFGIITVLTFVGRTVYFPVIIGLLLFTFLGGAIIYWVFVQPLAGRPSFIAIILTMAIGTILNAVVILIWGGGSSFQTISLGWRGMYTLPGDLRVTDRDIITLLSVIGVFLSLLFFYAFSKAGKQMRAVAENSVLASQRGIDINYSFAIAWGMGVCLAGIAAILLGQNYAISLEMGRIGLIGFVVAVVGGLDSVKGAIPGGFIVSLAELGTATYVHPRLTEVVPYIILLFVLIFRPWGLFGTEEEIERV